MSRCPCLFVCALCHLRIPHGRFFFALTGGRHAHLRCVEQQDLYDQITDPATRGVADKSKEDDMSKEITEAKSWDETNRTSPPSTSARGSGTPGTWSCSASPKKTLGSSTESGPSTSWPAPTGRTSCARRSLPLKRSRRRPTAAAAGS